MTAPDPAHLAKVDDFAPIDPGGLSRLVWLRYWRLLAVWTLVVSVVSGAAVTLHAGHGLSPFGGLEYVPGVVAVSLTRELCTRIATSATALALVHWAHRVGFEQLRRHLRRAIVRASLGALVALPAVVAVTFLSSFVVVRLVYGIRWATFLSGAMSFLSPMDPIVGIESTLISALLMGLLMWPALPALTRSKWPLFGKLALVWLSLCVFNGALSTATSWALG